MIELIYIYIYCSPQTGCFVVLQLFSVARHVGRSKLGSKPAKLYVRLSIRPLGQQPYHVGVGNYKVLCSSSRSIHSQSFALCERQHVCDHGIHALRLLYDERVKHETQGHRHYNVIYIYIYIYIYILHGSVFDIGWFVACFISWRINPFGSFNAELIYFDKSMNNSV